MPQILQSYRNLYYRFIFHNQRSTPYCLILSHLNMKLHPSFIDTYTDVDFVRYT